MQFLQRMKPAVPFEQAKGIRQAKKGTQAAGIQILFPVFVPTIHKKSSAQAKTKKETKENKGSVGIVNIYVVGDYTKLANYTTIIHLSA